MENIRKSIMIPLDIVERIEEYQRKNYLTTFSAAVIRLIIKGLEVGDKK